MTIYRFFLILIILFVSCTYSVKPPLPEGIKTIGVEPFSNVSERLGIESFVTQSFIEGLIEDRRIPVKDPASSDLIIKGEIKRYTRTPHGIKGAGEVYSYRVVIRATVRFFRRDGSEIFKARDFQGEATYDVREKSEEDAIIEASKDLARKVIQFIYAQAI